MLFIAIRIKTQPFLNVNREPFPYIFKRCADEFSQRRPFIFSNANLAQQFIHEQRRLQQTAFLLLAFERMRENLLRQILIQRDMGQFFAAAPRMHYFSPFSLQPRPIHYHRRHHALSLLDEDRDFLAAQDASMRPSLRTTRSPTTPVIKSAADFPAKDTVDNFSLSDLQQTEIKENKLSDPITLDDIDLTDGKRRLACVPSNGKHFIFDVDSILELVKRSTDGKTIQNPLTRADVSISDIFTVSAKQLTDFVAKKNLAPTKPLAGEETEVKQTPSFRR